MPNTIHELLYLLREQQGAMLGRKSAEVLSAFLAGYAFGRKPCEDLETQAFLRKFNGWVRKRFHREDEGQGWGKIIAFYSSDEGEEWKLFWKLYDEFMAKRNVRRSGATEAKA